MSLNAPAGVIVMAPVPGLVLADNVRKGLAIDKNGEVFWLYFAALRGSDGKPIAGSTATRVVRYPAGSPYGVELPLPFNANAAGMFYQFKGQLWIGAYHNTYTSGKTTYDVNIPVYEAVCPCDIY